MSAIRDLEESLEKFVVSTLESQDLSSIIGDTIDDKITEALEDFTPEIDADNVQGLENYIENAIDNYDLDTAIQNAIDTDSIAKEAAELAIEKVNDWDWETKIQDGIDTDSIANAVLDKVNEEFPFEDTLILQLENSKEVQEALDKAVAASLQRVLGRLLTGVVPVATPVEKVDPWSLVEKKELGVPTATQPMDYEQHVRQVMDQHP